MSSTTVDPYQDFADTICKAIRDERIATEDFVRDVNLFLEELPLDLGKGSLNGMRAQLQQKCAEFLFS